MLEFLELHRRKFLISGIVICLLAIVFTINPNAGPSFIERGLSRIVVPMQRGLTSVIAFTSGHFTALTNNARLLEEMETLRSEKNLLVLEMHRLELVDAENARLSQLLNINQRYRHLPKLGGRVIGHDPNAFNASFHVDRGTTDGIEVNMAVLGTAGFVGVVNRVQPGSALVVSVIDYRFSAAVMSSRTEDLGMARGDIRLMQQGLLRMDHISAVAEIVPGDEIITSPHSSIFPAGLLVGTVLSIHPNPDGLTRYALIEPAAELNNIEMVLIVTEIFEEQIMPDEQGVR